MSDHEVVVSNDESESDEEGVVAFGAGKGILIDGEKGAKKKKVGVKVGFGEEEVIVESGPSKSGGKGKRQFEKEDGEKRPRKKAEDIRHVGDVEEGLRVTEEVNFKDWAKRSQSMGIFTDSPWGEVKVTVVKATNVPPNSNKKCECFVKGYLGQAKFSTPIVKHLNSPEWNQSYTMPFEPQQSLKLKLFDNVGKGSRTADIPLGMLKIRLKNTKPGKHSKTFEMKMDSSLKHVEKIQITMELEYKINPVRLNHVHSKLFCQPTWLSVLNNPLIVEAPTPGEMKVAVVKTAERVCAWIVQAEAAVGDQRWKIRVLDVSMSLGYREIFVNVTYVNLPRGDSSEEVMEYRLVEDDDEEDLGPKDSRQLAFESFHSLVPKDVIKMCNDKKHSDQKTSIYNFRKHSANYPPTLGLLLGKSSQFLTENGDLDHINTSALQTNVSNHVVVWFWV